MTILEAKDLSYFYQDGEKKTDNPARYLSEIWKRAILYDFRWIRVRKNDLLSLISALDAPTAGEILYNGEDIRHIGYDRFRRDDVSIIFQNYNLVPYLTGLENVLVAMSITDNEMPKDTTEIAYNLLDYIGINKVKADRLVNQLSGGEQQRIAIARALATNVDIILADEPTGNLDVGMEEEIVTIFKELASIHHKCNRCDAF